jgi:hypothetical protein
LPAEGADGAPEVKGDLPPCRPQHLTAFGVLQQQDLQRHKVASLTLAFFCCAGLFALSAPLQILLLQNAKGGGKRHAVPAEPLGNHHSAAEGADGAPEVKGDLPPFCGGMMIAQGFGWNSVALPAATLSFLAMSALLIYLKAICPPAAPSISPPLAFCSSRICSGADRANSPGASRP